MRDWQKPGKRERHCTSLAVCEAVKVIPPLTVTVPGPGKTFVGVLARPPLVDLSRDDPEGPE